MSVSQILDANGKISESYLPSNAGGVPTLGAVLATDNDAKDLFIDNCGGLELSNGAGIPAIATLTAQFTPVPTSSPPSTTGNCLNVENASSTLCDIQIQNLYLGGPSTDIKLSVINGFDPAGDASEILKITDYINGTAGLDCGSASMTYLQIQSADNRIYFQQALNSSTVGSEAGRIPIICGGTTYFLQVYNEP